MKRIFSFLCVLCCASVMGFAIDWSGYDFLGDGAGGGAYSNKYKVAPAEGQRVDNIQKPGFANAPGIYTTFPAGISDCSLGAGNYAIQGAGIILYVSAFTAQETEVTVTHGTGKAVFTVYYADGTTGGGGGDPTPDPDPEPEPDPVSYCDFPTGHESNPNFGDANGRILLSLEPTGNANEYKMTIKPNYANGATKKLDYLYVIAGGNTPYPATSGTDDDGNAYDEMSVTFTNSNATTSFTIQWSNPDWGGRWQCALNDVPLTSLSACAGGGAPDPDPEPTEIYDVNFALASNGSSATASSGNAALAIDGDEGTRWESSHTDDETWTLDMGQKRIFNTIKIKWEGAYCKEYTLSYSNDGESWSPLYTETNLTQAGWQTIELGENVTARYINYHGT